MTSPVAVFHEINEAMAAGGNDPYPMLAERRRNTPVMEGDIALELGGMSFAGMHDGPAFTLFRREDVVAAFRDGDTFSSAIYDTLQGQYMGRTVLGMDGEEHRIWRGLLTPAFSNRALGSWENETVIPLAKRLIAEMADQGRANLIDFAVQVPILAIYAMVGLSPEHESFQEFSALSASMLLALAANPDPAEAERTQRNIKRAFDAATTMFDRMLLAVERKRAEGNTHNDLITHLINAEFEGRQLSDIEIATFVRSLFPAATETTTRLFLITAAALLERPELAEAVHNDRSLVMPLMLEAERYETTTLAVPRLTTKEVTVCDVTIPADAAVVLCVGSANRDDTAYADPDEFILNREGPPGLAFGFGSHLCVGRYAARREIHAMLDAVLDLPGLRLDPDAAPPVIEGVAVRSPGQLNVVWQ